MPSRKRWSRRVKKAWRGHKPEEGSEVELRLIPVTYERAPAWKEASKSRRWGVAAGFWSVSARASNDKGVAPSVRREALRGERSPWTGHQPWTWLWDETSLQSRGAEQTVARLRKPEDGT